VGEFVDVDGDTGGYNLQRHFLRECWLLGGIKSDFDRISGLKKVFQVA